MSYYSSLLVTISIVGVLFIIIHQLFKKKNTRLFIISICALMLIVTYLHKYFYSIDLLASKGDGNENELLYLIVLFIFMILGMVSQYLFSRFNQPKKDRSDFDWGIFIAPIFTSPIVFIPLYTIISNSSIDSSNFDSAKYMIFLVAFENGFFWKGFLDNQKRLK